MNGDRKRRWRIKPRILRACTVGAVLVSVVVGLALHTGWGTPSAMGIGYVAAICPLGALESLLGAGAFVPRLLLGLAAALIVALLVGRAFCSWICPVPPISRLLSSKRAKAREAVACREAGQFALERYEGDGEPTRAKIDARHIVLCGTLGSAAVFGFPVFCLICPVGLTFATVIALARLIGFNEPSWGLLVFPAIIVLELTVLRAWCGKICPIGALLSLVARLNRTWKPRVDRAKCLRTTSGERCAACSTACPEHIDPNANRGVVAINECTRCKRCAEACPQGAIEFPFIANDHAAEPAPEQAEPENEPSLI